MTADQYHHELFREEFEKRVKEIVYGTSSHGNQALFSVKNLMNIFDRSAASAGAALVTAFKEKTEPSARTNDA